MRQNRRMKFHFFSSSAQKDCKEKYSGSSTLVLRIRLRSPNIILDRTVHELSYIIFNILFCSISFGSTVWSGDAAFVALTSQIAFGDCLSSDPDQKNSYNVTLNPKQASGEAKQERILNSKQASSETAETQLLNIQQ